MPGERRMTCEEIRTRLLDYQEGRLPMTAHGEVHAHLEDCLNCAHTESVQEELTWILERRLPQYPAPLTLKRRLAAQWPAPAANRSRWSRWRPGLRPALAAAA